MALCALVACVTVCMEILMRRECWPGRQLRRYPLLPLWHVLRRLSPFHVLFLKHCYAKLTAIEAVCDRHLPPSSRDLRVPYHHANMIPTLAGGPKQSQATERPAGPGRRTRAHKRHWRGRCCWRPWLAWGQGRGCSWPRPCLAARRPVQHRWLWRVCGPGWCGDALLRAPHLRIRRGECGVLARLDCPPLCLTCCSPYMTDAMGPFVVTAALRLHNHFWLQGRLQARG